MQPFFVLIDLIDLKRGEKKMSKYQSVKLMPLNIHRQRKTIIVEVIHTSDFYEMSPAAADALEEIQLGLSLQEIEAKLRSKYPDEDINIEQFIDELIELNIVSEIDGVSYQKYDNVTPQREKPQSELINQLGRFLFRTPFIFVYVIAFFYSIWMIFANPQVGPRPHTMHMYDSMTLNVIIWAGLSLLLLAFHEFSHFLAARSYGVPAKYSLSHRLYFLVLETDISGVWKLQPRQRLVPYMAGMLNDSLMLAISIAARVIFPEMNDIVYQIFELATVYTCVMLVFQTFVFMKTDLYYVIETLSGTLNLKERTDSWLKGLFTNSKEKEVAFIKYYSVIYIGGLLFSIWLFVTIAYPQFLHFLEHARDYLSYPVTHFYFWDGVLFLIFNGLSLALLFYSWMRKLSGYIRAKRGQSMAS